MVVGTVENEIDIYDIVMINIEILYLSNFGYIGVFAISVSLYFGTSSALYRLALSSPKSG